jgi:hypothetical protein
MPETDSGFFREAIRRTLENRAGDISDADAIAESFSLTWQRVAARISPVIGERGTDTLLSRCVHLTSNDYPWLAMAGDQGERESRLAVIKTRLAGAQPDAAREAGYALLTTFIGLLTTLIGETLTERLMGPVWTSPSPAPEQERVA